MGTKWKESKGFFLSSGGSFNMHVWVEEDTTEQYMQQNSH